MDAEEIVSAVTRGDISIDNVVEDSLTRCAAVQEKLNPFTAIYADEARQNARAATARLKQAARQDCSKASPSRSRNSPRSRVRSHHAAQLALKDCVEDVQPALVRRLEEAGAIIVARTTTPEFAHSSFTRSPLDGHTRNPFDPTRSCGGSSGGAGVAVATGCVPLAEGTDMGGSVRIPAGPLWRYRFQTQSWPDTHGYSADRF